jgi:hypothetical protein
LKKFFTVSKDESIKQISSSTKIELPKHLELVRMRSVTYSQSQRINILRAKGIFNDGIWNMDSLKIDSQLAVALYQPQDFDVTKKLMNLNKQFVLSITFI